MALTLNDIDINVKHGLAAAHDVATAADDLHAAYEEGVAIIEDLRGYWTGDNATRYLALLTERVERLRVRSDTLSRIAGAMRETVEVYRQDQLDQHYQELYEREKDAEQKDRQ